MKLSIQCIFAALLVFVPPSQIEEDASIVLTVHEELSLPTEDEYDLHQHTEGRCNDNEEKSTIQMNSSNSASKCRRKNRYATPRLPFSNMYWPISGVLSFLSWDVIFNGEWFQWCCCFIHLFVTKSTTQLEDKCDHEQEQLLTTSHSSSNRQRVESDEKTTILYSDEGTATSNSTNVASSRNSMERHDVPLQCFPVKDIINTRNMKDHVVQNTKSFIGHMIRSRSEMDEELPRTKSAIQFFKSFDSEIDHPLGY